MLPTARELLDMALAGGLRATIYVQVRTQGVDVGFFSDRSDQNGLLVLDLCWEFKNEMTISDDVVKARLSSKGNWYECVIPMLSIVLIMNRDDKGNAVRAVSPVHTLPETSKPTQATAGRHLRLVKETDDVN